MERPPFFLLLLLVLHLLSLPFLSFSKSTIEPCTGSDSCPALLGYTLYADLKVSEVAALFQADPIAVLTANAIDISVSDVENHILPAGLFLRIPTLCSCSDGIRKSVSTRYKTRPADTLTSIANSIFAGLASPDQIREANGISDPSALDIGQTLLIPLPCTCFNSTDNNLPAIYLSYVVKAGDTVTAIATSYSTTVTDIMNVNAMGNPAIRPGDIIAIPLPDNDAASMRQDCYLKACGRGILGCACSMRQLSCCKSYWEGTSSSNDYGMGVGVGPNISEIFLIN
ncbi:putative LysM domain-containing GPI-anchored protein 1 [Cocos nucifera]|nr:putative LysM domain-containing GPI-anchored protein 1 [Cocos nucifera]